MRAVDPAMVSTCEGGAHPGTRYVTLNAVAMSDTPFAYPGGWLPIRYEQRCRERRALLDEALSAAVAVASERADVVRLIVFGSYARGAISAWSDLDLLVIADDDAAPAVDAINAAARYGDVLGMRAADARVRLGVTPLGRTIECEGIVIYARHAG